VLATALDGCVICRGCEEARRLRLGPDLAALLFVSVAVRDADRVRRFAHDTRILDAILDRLGDVELFEAIRRAIERGDLVALRPTDLPPVPRYARVPRRVWHFERSARGSGAQAPQPGLRVSELSAGVPGGTRAIPKRLPDWGSRLTDDGSLPANTASALSRVYGTTCDARLPESTKVTGP
jgi:hypothetical protein